MGYFKNQLIEQQDNEIALEEFIKAFNAEQEAWTKAGPNRSATKLDENLKFWDNQGIVTKEQLQEAIKQDDFRIANRWKNRVVGEN